jgi:hypothetical protein
MTEFHPFCGCILFHNTHTYVYYMYISMYTTVSFIFLTIVNTTIINMGVQKSSSHADFPSGKFKSR